MLHFFVFDHLPAPLADVSKPFRELAEFIVANTYDCVQQEVALQKLLEAKDAAVRAAILG